MCFSNISNCNLVALASIVSISISEGKSNDEIATLSAFFAALGDNLAIMALENTSNNTSESKLENSKC